MSPDRSCWIYHLARRDGSALFLHPFVKRGSFLDLPAGTELEGYYGREPRVESLSALRTELYRRADEDVRDWINERRFIPRFLFASMIFLVVFLFMSLVVHTPIPLLDELLASGAAGATAFVMAGRFFEKTGVAVQRRDALHAQVDNVLFNESDYVHKLENAFHHLDRTGAAVSSGSADRYNHGYDQDGRYHDGSDETSSLERKLQDLWQDNREETQRVLELLKTLLGVNPWKRAARELRRGRLSRKVEDLVHRGEVEPALITLYDKLRRSAP